MTNFVPVIANIVCDQITFCLEPTEIASRNWAPISECANTLKDDCLEDPSDFAQCITDLETSTCDDFGAFESVPLIFQSPAIIYALLTRAWV